MAKLSSDDKYVTVEKGDTLSEIASDFKKYRNNYWKSYKDLAKINDIANANLIYPNQKIYFAPTYVSDDPVDPANNKKQQPKYVTKTHFGVSASNDKKLFAMWKWAKDGLTEKYAIAVWVLFKDTPDYVEYKNDSVEAGHMWYEFDIPDDVHACFIRIKPIAKKKKNGDYEFTADLTPVAHFQHYVQETIPTPPTPTVSMEGFNITASVSNLENPPSIVQFQLIKNDSESGAKTMDAAVSTGTAEVIFKNVAAGGRYKVRCRGKRDKKFGNWSQYSESFTTIPAAPGKLSKCEPQSLADPASIYVAWAAVENADEYEIQYTTKESYFDTSDKVTSKTGIKATAWTITDIETGYQYFVRVRAKNDKGESGWSPVSSTKIGTAPAAPTTWSSTNTVVAGDPLTFYWVHNTEDGSTQNGAKIQIYVGDEELPLVEFNDADKENEKDKTRSYNFPMVDNNGTPLYADGTVIRWAVKTVGLANTWSDWSVQREVKVYAPASVTITAPNTITSFPISISVDATPENQTPIGYYVSVLAEDGYETTDNLGNTKTVGAGEIVFAKHIDPPETDPHQLNLTLSAGDLTLEDGEEYRIVCSVFMDSGLSGESYKVVSVDFESINVNIDAEATVDMTTLSVTIKPECATYSTECHKVTYADGEYILTNEIIEYGVYKEETLDEKLETGESIYVGSVGDEEGNDVEGYYCDVLTKTSYTGVMFDIYRREYDGSFTPIYMGLDGAEGSYITDPHPALDYARYRIVATVKSTSEVFYEDLPAITVGCKSIVVQWDEQWDTLKSLDNDDVTVEKMALGSVLKLPYNIDVSNSHDPDVELVEYIGRRHPVSYYGTQRGETATWDVVIEKSDTATLSALRRLAVWAGDVYVREPSGSGYWANIKVSFSQKHNELTIPVTLDITRVEGGA